jgi:gluconate 2-dehydrogenase gamma chain
MKRRHFLHVSVSAWGGALVYSLSRQPSRLLAQTPTETTMRIPLQFFTESEALDISAAIARIFPADDAGPGASEAGATVYIDRQLAGPYGKDQYRFTQGPFREGVLEQGYQGPKTPRDLYRQGLKQIAGLARLKETEQDARLRQIETTPFFQLLRTHTIEGMFCDPMHGGNVDLIGWQLIGFPGPRMSYRDEIEQYRGKAFRPKPQSLGQVLGRDHVGHGRKP